MAFQHFKSEVDELRERIALSRFADELLEEAVRDRDSQQAALERILPRLSERLGATGASLSAFGENLRRAVHACGSLASDTAPAGQTLIREELDVAGECLGSATFAFDGALGDAEPVARERVRCVCEQLDALLATWRTAGQKQNLIERLNRALSNRVFEAGLDEAVSLLHASVGLATFAFLWRDAVREKALDYRIYEDGVVRWDAENRPHPALAAVIQSEGVEVLAPDREAVGAGLGLRDGFERPLTRGGDRSQWMGKYLAVPGRRAFATFELDLIRLLAEMARERLVDHNRERRHLSQFFAPRVISALLREPAYLEKHLRPREEEVGVLYADINGFTKISEQVLETPSAIGAFVDRWSAGAVEILFRHGGTFDKMVGDCVIGLFGPPFYEEPPARRALRAVLAAREIQAWTIATGADPMLARLGTTSELPPGLGVAVGVSLTRACVGTFGPNQDVTAFSAGMNATARLQGLAGFREILVMEDALAALATQPEASELSFGAIRETPVKNVRKPLRYAPFIS